MTVLFPTLKTVARIGGVTVLAGLVAFSVAPRADAHVHALADSTTAGSFTSLTFRVPNESDSAGTVKVSVQLPQDTPFLEVSIKPLPGWKAASTEERLPKPVEFEGTTLTKAVRTVTWTADRGTQVGPGEYQEFALSVGPLPGAGTVLLPVTQTYSDGKVEKWDEPTPPSGEEPENPAPEIVITAATPSGGASSTSPTPAATSEPAARSDSDVTARVLGVAGLVIGLAALAVAVIGRRRNGSPAA